jgi:hypothetical protein
MINAASRIPESFYYGRLVESYGHNASLRRQYHRARRQALRALILQVSSSGADHD